MYENQNDCSLFADVMSGAEAGAAFGKCLTGIASAVTGALAGALAGCRRSEEHTAELQSPRLIAFCVFWL